MKIIIGKTGQGEKTTRLIQMSAENWAYIVVRDHRRAYEVSEQAREMGLEIPFPVSFGEFTSGRFYSYGVRGFLVDDADTLLRMFAKGVPILAITLTEDENDESVDHKICFDRGDY